MYELSAWDLPSFYRLIILYSLSRGLVLRDHRLKRSDGSLRGWKVLCCLINRVFKLLDWDISGLNWFISMH